MGIFSAEKNPGFFSIFSMKELTISYNVSKGKVPKKFLRFLKNCQNFDHFFAFPPWGAFFRAEMAKTFQKLASPKEKKRSRE
jgi:hypothetical protein